MNMVIFKDSTNSSLYYLYCHKVPVTAAQFLGFPSADKLLRIGDERGQLILKELGVRTRS